MKRSANKLKLILVVALAVFILILAAFYFFNKSVIQFAPPGQLSVTRSVEFFSDSYKVTLTITPSSAANSIAISDSVSGGTIDQSSVSFMNFKDYQTFSKGDSIHLDIVLLSPFDAAPNNVVRVSYLVKQTSATPKFSGSWKVPTTNQKGTISGTSVAPAMPAVAP